MIHIRRCSLLKKILIGLFILSFILFSILNINNTIVYGIKAYSNTENMIDGNNEKIMVSNDQKKLLEKINLERKKENLQPLEFRQDLIELAKLKAEDLVNNHYFDHNSKQYGSIFDMLKKNDIHYKIAGENLAGARNINLAVHGWMNSPSHKDNILEEKYKYTGIYIFNSNTYGKVFVQVFLG